MCGLLIDKWSDILYNGYTLKWMYFFDEREKKLIAVRNVSVVKIENASSMMASSMMSMRMRIGARGQLIMLR